MDFLADVAGLAHRPLPTLIRIERTRSQTLGLLALLLAFGLPLLVAELTAIHQGPPPSPGPFANADQLFDAQVARTNYEQRFGMPVEGALAGLLFWLVATALIHLVARRLGGKGSFIGYLELAGYILCLGLLAVPFNLMLDSGQVGQTSRTLLAIGLGLFLWQALLLVLAARVHYGMSPENAVYAVVGPVGCLCMCVGILLVAALFDLFWEAIAHQPNLFAPY